MGVIKRNGFDRLQVHTFSNLHKQHRRVLDLSDAGLPNISRVLATAIAVGLLVDNFHSSQFCHSGIITPVCSCLHSGHVIRTAHRLSWGLAGRSGLRL